MKTNVTKRIVTFVLAFAVVFTTVFAGGTSVEAAENVQTLYISSALENATAGSEIKVPTNPNKESTAEFTYEFIGWDKDNSIFK